MNTLDFYRHDLCSRLRTWRDEYDLPRIPLAEALQKSLRVGLLSAEPSAAGAHLLSLAASPGLDLQGVEIYPVAVHHAALLEVLTAYLTPDGPWCPAEPSMTESFGTFQPLSYQMSDGRLRRVILCSNWNTLREQEESLGWMTVADTAITNRPILVNAIVIGASRAGYRSSPWTTAYIHPKSKELRIKKREGKFDGNWKAIRRENTSKDPLQWLSLIQQDGAFEGLVESMTCNPPSNRDEVLSHLDRMALEIMKGSLEMRRSACFGRVPCSLAGICHHPTTPAKAGWARRECEVSGHVSAQKSIVLL